MTTTRLLHPISLPILMLVAGCAGDVPAYPNGVVPPYDDETLATDPDRPDPVEPAPPAVAEPGETISAMCQPLQPDGLRPFPCGDVPAGGRCTAEGAVERCVSSSSDGEQPYVEQTQCPVGMACDDAGGRATCRLFAECRGTERRCIDSLAVGRCDDGVLVPDGLCASGCRSTLAGDSCRPTGSTRGFEGRVVVGDGAGQELEVEGALVVVRDGDTIYDATHSGAGGRVALSVPTTPGSGARIEVFAASADAEGLHHFVTTLDVAPETSTFDYDLSSADVFAVRLRIPAGRSATLALGAGAWLPMSAFLLTERASTWGRDTLRDPGARIAVLIRPGLGCGSAPSCLLGRNLVIAGQPVESILLLGHEDSLPSSSLALLLGHWWLDSHSGPTFEGGWLTRHLLVTPGLAWADGFARWFRAELLEARLTGAVTRPSPGGVSPECGLEQLMSASEVAEMIGELAAVTGRETMLRVSGSEQMREGFLRGYHTHISTWRDTRPDAIYETDLPAPYFADFLDALRCDGQLTAEEVDAITRPDRYYPYAGSRPTCR